MGKGNDPNCVTATPFAEPGPARAQARSSQRSSRRRGNGLGRPSASRTAGQRNMVTAKGIPVRMDLYEQVPDGGRDGWVVDLVEAHGPYGPAGYLKISYIPRKNAERLYPDALHYIARERGNGTFKRLIDIPEERWDRKQLVSALQAASQQWPTPTYEEESLNQLRQLWERQRALLCSRHDQGYQEFLDFHVDRPLVDFVRVYREGDRSGGWVGGQKVDVDGAEYGGLGVGTAMYETAALWLAQRGMHLHASGIQSTSAGEVWARFRERGLVIPAPDSPERYVLDVSKLQSDPVIRLSEA